MGEGREGMCVWGVSSVRRGGALLAGQGKVRASAWWKYQPWTWSAF